jgi:periplasmic protein TonB
MPHDLFGAAAGRPPSRSAVRRFLTVFSVALHAIAVTAIVVVQVFAVGPLPYPHRPLIFEEVRLVHLAEIRVPAPRRRSPGSPPEPVSANRAPIVEPRGVAPETGLENLTPRHELEGTGPGVGPGMSIVDSIGSVTTDPPPPVAPRTPIRVHEGMQAPKKIADVTPVYPSIAQTVRVEGVVILEAVIDARGNVTSVEVLRSIPLLDRAAIDAVRQWRYTPALLNGQAVPVVVTVTVRFQLK